MTRPDPRIWKITVALLAASALGACSGSGSSTATKATVAAGAGTAATVGGAPAATAAPPTAAAPAAAASTATGGLSGTWSGQYSGAFQGTFTLTWQQSGSTLSGTIKLSAPPLNLPISGNVNGSAIQFGTLGAVGVTYSGSVSGNTMSGTYTAGTTARGGSWSATNGS